MLTLPVSSSVHWGGGGGGGGIVKLWVGNNVMRLFSFLYIAASHMVHVHYFSCVLLVVIFCMYYFLGISLVFFSVNVENVRECWKLEWVCVDQRIELYWPKSYLSVFIITVKTGVVTMKVDPSTRNLTRKETKMESDWYWRRRKKRKKGKRKQKDGEDKQNPSCWQWCQSFILRD